jgi:hypothetical protein
MTVTAAVLYDLVQCPQRVALDAFGNAADRDKINPFVHLLWNAARCSNVKRSLSCSFHSLISPRRAKLIASVPYLNSSTSLQTSALRTASISSDA